MSPSFRSLRTRAVFCAAALCVTATAVAGCRGDREDKPPRQILPDMDDQPKYTTQGESKFFADGRAMRQPVAGTVPWGRQSQLSYGVLPDERDAAASQLAQSRADLLADDDAVYRGIGPDGQYVDIIPIPVTAELLRMGQEQYNIYCIVCHGGTGDGRGTVGLRWSYPLPTFHDPQYQHGGEKGQDGYIFHVIRNGVPNAPGLEPRLKMPSYSGQIDVRESWAIVAYFRALQRSRTTPVERAPASLREELMRTRGVPASPAQTQQAQPQENQQ